MTEKIRQLTNKVHLAGALVELINLVEGTTQQGIPYISFRGVIQCGESQASRVRFRTFVKSKKKDGTDSKNFAKVKDWAKNAVPMTSNEKNPTYVDCVGSITDNPYVSSDGQLREATDFNIQLFGDFDTYAAEIDLEGFIHSIKDETKGEEEVATGRQRMRLISRDMFGNMLDFKSVVIPEELVEAVSENGYEKGATATFYITLTLSQNVNNAPKNGGIGEQRVSGGKPYLEWVITGADPVIDSESEQALEPKLIKAAMVERQAHLDEVKAAGYLGNKGNTPSTAPASTRNSIGNSSAKSDYVELPDVEDEDDFPF